MSIRRFVPPQHGAWAMLVVPFLMGTIASSWTWLALPLLVAWVDAYLLSYFGLQWLRARRKQRFVAPMRLYAAVLVPLGVVLVVAQPSLLWWGLAFVPLSLVNVWYARRNDERSLVNGIASVVQACLMVLVAYDVGGGTDRALAARVFAAALLYFTGTVLFVKTMIRERGEASYYRLAVGYHVAALLAAALISPWLAVPFGLYLLRAAVLPRRELRPAQVGAVEIVNSVLLVAVTAAVL